MGSLFGGFALYVKRRTPVLGAQLRRHGGGPHRRRERRSHPGAHTLAFRFDAHRRASGGTGRLLVDGAVVGEGAIEQLTPARFSITGAGLTCGRDAESAVTPRYEAPFPFTGTLHRVVVDLEGESTQDPDLYAEARLRNQ